MTLTGTQSRGDFFIIDKRFLSLLAARGLNPLVAYLVLANGTGPDNKTTAWSINAIQNHTGMTFERGTAAIATLCEIGALNKTKGGTRPQYQLLTWQEFSKAWKDQQAATLTSFERDVLHGKARGKSKRYCEAIAKLEQLGWWRPRLLLALEESEEEPKQHLIWLPKTIVQGTSRGESSPLRRLRSLGRASALQLFIGLYHAHNLRDDFGIKRNFLWANFTRKIKHRVGKVIVWSFEYDKSFLKLSGPFAFYADQPNTADRNPWEDLNHLRDMGLIRFVTHIVEGVDSGAEIVHSVMADGDRSAGELEAAESTIAMLAPRIAARILRMSGVDNIQSGDEFLYPMFVNNFPNVQMVGIAQLTYRPHTSRTSAWYKRSLAAISEAIEELDRVVNSLQPTASANNIDIKGVQSNQRKIKETQGVSQGVYEGTATSKPPDKRMNSSVIN